MAWKDSRSLHLRVSFVCSFFFYLAEDQACDRVHRLGQTKDVEVVRFICAGTVEEKILELQNTKRDMTTTALSKHSKSKEDQKEDRLNDLVQLFQ